MDHYPILALLGLLSLLSLRSLLTLLVVYGLSIHAADCFF